MNDWLTELRESKQHAIEQAQTEVARGQLQREATEDQLQSEQALLATLIKTVQVEQLLQQFTSEILQGHPFFSNTSLTRTVRSKAVGSAIELTEPAPWSALVTENPLPENLDLGNGHYVIAIVWKLQSNYRSLHDKETQSYRMTVSSSASQVLMDGRPLLPQTSDVLKTRLTTTFRDSLERLNRRRVHHHRHRPWYKRLWRTFFPHTDLTAFLLIGALVIVAFSILLAVVAAQILTGMSWGVRPPR